MIFFGLGEPPPELDEDSTTSWQGAEVRIALSEHFASKCYLCESVRRSAQVEHLRPRGAFPDRLSRWDNLFLACDGSCNQRRIHWETREQATTVDGKPVRWPKGGMLNPKTDADLADRIRHRVVWRDQARLSVEFEAVDPTDLPAVHTAIEAQYIHEQRQGREICSAIEDWIHAAGEKLQDLLLAEARNDPESRAQASARLRNMLSPRSPYTGVTRAYFRRKLRENPRLLKELGL